MIDLGLSLPVIPAVGVSFTSIESSVTGGAEVENLLVLQAGLVLS